MSKKQSLKRRLKTAEKRIFKEARIIVNARSRRHYWQKISLELESRLDLINNGQIEMKFK